MDKIGEIATFRPDFKQRPGCSRADPDARRAVRDGLVISCATPRKHPLARRKSVRWAELQQHRAISTWKGAGVRVAMDIDLAKSNNELASFYEVQQIYTALRLVEAGFGVAVPAFFIEMRERAAFGVTSLVDPVITADLWTVVLRNHPLRRQALDFWQLTHCLCGR